MWMCMCVKISKYHVGNFLKRLDLEEGKLTSTDFPLHTFPFISTTRKWTKQSPQYHMVNTISHSMD